jgi:hypothetical protein
LETFYKFFNDTLAVQAKNPDILTAHKTFKILFRQYKKETASHWEKRQLVSPLVFEFLDFVISVCDTGETTWS